MFFAPPKVKSLSRYAEYGAYLSHKHFLLMLAVAVTAHLGVIAIYSMVPSQEIVRIPVRVLNIKLAAGGNASAHMPEPSIMPEVKAPADEQSPATPNQPEEMKLLREENGESAVEKALVKNHVKPVPHQQSHPAQAEREKIAHAKREVHDSEYVPAPESTFATPKKYVREEGAASGKAEGNGHGKVGNGNGSIVGGDVGGKEEIERYTQTISQWIKNHQIYAKAACGEAQAAGAQCDAKGQVVMRLRIDRDGHILYKSVDKTSGRELVDQAATAMVNASDPVPSVPSNYPSDSQLEFLIAVQVDLSKQ